MSGIVIEAVEYDYDFPELVDGTSTNYLDYLVTSGKPRAEAVAQVLAMNILVGQLVETSLKSANLGIVAPEAITPLRVARVIGWSGLFELRDRTEEQNRFRNEGLAVVDKATRVLRWEMRPPKEWLGLPPSSIIPEKPIPTQ